MGGEKKNNGWRRGRRTTATQPVQMTRHLIRNRITDPEMLKEFEWEGVRFDAALSRGDDWTFTV